MAPIIVTARIVCKSKEARETVLSAFHKIIEFTQPHEPEVLRYVVTLPVDDTTGTVLYMIEEYASPAANDAHIATPPVHALIQLFTTGDVLAKAPEVHICPIIANNASYPVPSLSSSPAVVLAHFGYKPGTLPHALEGWKAVVEYVSKEEYWTRGYTVGEDKEGESVRTVEVYESWEFLEKVHVKSEAVRRNEAHNGRDRTGVHGAVRVRTVDGFLGRDEGERGKL
ncbi:hypothetical protein K458DRAFT_363249 [Lentithecium fluviatile CBS 122367]|uniref:ABM domain-containing protein n=1 Tax=Lentithecium fluviatile CBS 122367 TaxID=1168545 RepID=A0A6G1J8N1_9PLEO|nr:hypothetical protein K458DRAFT_363249 [Lentithecium fluviatile CBS 122367]